MAKALKPYIWDLSELYSSPQDPKLTSDLTSAQTAVDEFVSKWRHQTDYITDPVSLREALDDYEQLNRSVGAGQRVSYFVGLSRVINQNDAELKGLETRLDEQTTALANQLTFFELSLGQIPASAQRHLLQAAELTPHRAWLQRRFAAATHDLGEEATNALNVILPQASDAWESMVEELLAAATARVYDGQATRRVPFNSLPQLLTSPDPRVVAEAGAAMTRIMRRLAPIAEREINAIVTTNLRYSRLARYDRPDARRFEADDLEPTVAETMLHTVEQRFDLSQRFYRLKANLLGRTNMAYHERVATYGQLPRGYRFEAAIRFVRQALEQLHPDFAREFDTALHTGHIDAQPREGKRGGAACWHSLLEHPTYLMLNFTGELHDIVTLGHEFGHYLNNLHMQRSCNSLNYGATTPMAEVASTFFEKYVLETVTGELDDETRLALMVSSLDNEVATIFRQSAAMRFEQALYQAIDEHGYLAYPQIGQLFAHHMSSYLGDAVRLDNGADLWWLYWGHFRTLFYNYSYSFALLVAKALQTRLAADASYIEQVQRLLACGRSQRPTDLLASLQLDITAAHTWQLSLNQIATDLDATEALARRLGKL